MEGYVDGDQRAFDRLFAMLTPKLRGFLLRLVRDEAVAEDLVQLTMLKAHLARDRFQLQGGDPDGAVQGWYFAIARNVALDHLRKRSRRDKRHARGREGEDVFDSVADATPTIEQATAQEEQEREIVERVRDAIGQLPESQRDVVELHKLRGLSMAEVADRLQIREGAVRVRAHRGYKALARLLGASTVLWALLESASTWEVLG